MSRWSSLQERFNNTSLTVIFLLTHTFLSPDCGNKVKFVACSSNLVTVVTNGSNLHTFAISSELVETPPPESFNSLRCDYTGQLSVLYICAIKLMSSYKS